MQWSPNESCLPYSKSRRRMVVLGSVVVVAAADLHVVAWLC